MDGALGGRAPGGGAREWPPGPEAAEVAPGEVHVWTAWLDVDPESRGRLAATLSDDERERARRFVDARDGHRWSAGRGALRDVLGRYLGRPPASIRFAYGPAGDPRLDASISGTPPLPFNASRSGPVALYAVGRASPVGVDVEEMVAGRDVTAVAEGFFSARERDELARLPEDLRVPAFYRYWTSKEACLKALGLGLHGPLDAVEVAPGPEGEAVVARMDRGAGPAVTWSLTHLEPRDGWVGALAVPGAEPSVRLWTWRP